MATAIQRSHALVPVAEAAFIADLTDRQLNRAIDERIISRQLVATDDGRRFAKLASAQLKFYFDFEPLLTAGARKDVINILCRRLSSSPRWQDFLQLAPSTRTADWTVSVSDLTIHLDHTVQAVQHKMVDLDLARSVIHQDLDILGGPAVFSGTRVPIDNVLAMRRAGATLGEIKQHYPSVTGKKLKAAEVYQRVHPKRGRPRSAQASQGPWKPISTQTIPRKGNAAKVPGSS